MKTYLWMMLTILGGGLVVASDGVPKPLPKPIPDAISTQKKSTPQIVIPVVPILDEGQVPEEDHPAPVPKPNRGPVPVSSLSEDTWYVIESPVPLIILSSPPGHVQIDPDEGPVKLRGKFSDGSGKNEIRTYSSKYVYSVSALKAGQIELLIVPIGVSAEAEVIRQPLTVMGLAPIPPPVPKPDPDVVPVPVPDPVPVPPTGIRVLLLYNEDAGRSQLDTVNSVDIVKWMTENCAKSSDGRPEWRRWDRTSISKAGMLDKETPVWQKLWKDIQGSITQDNMVVVVTDTKAVVQPMGDPASTLALLNRVKEGR